MIVNTLQHACPPMSCKCLLPKPVKPVFGTSRAGFGFIENYGRTVRTHEQEIPAAVGHVTLTKTPRGLPVRRAAETSGIP